VAEALPPDGAFGAHLLGPALTSPPLTATFTFRVKEHVRIFAAAPR
jgi:hypothetical protein